MLNISKIFVDYLSKFVFKLNLFQIIAEIIIILCCSICLCKNYRHTTLKLQDELQKLLSDLKEEGNASFKDKDYCGSYDFYTSALNICKHLQTNQFVSVDKDLLSTIFSNRAACLLKMVRINAVHIFIAGRLI